MEDFWNPKPEEKPEVFEGDEEYKKLLEDFGKFCDIIQRIGVANLSPEQREEVGRITQAMELFNNVNNQPNN